MQDLGTPLEQVVGFIALGLAGFLIWWSDRMFNKATEFEISFRDSSEEGETEVSKRKETFKAHVRLWWGSTLLQTALVVIGGHLIFDMYGAVTLGALFCMTRVIPGVFHMRVDHDTLAAFEKHLVMKAAIEPFSEELLREEIEQRIEKRILSREDYERLLRYLSRRNDIIGESALSLLSASFL